MIPALSYGADAVRQLRQKIEIQLVMMVKFSYFIEEIYKEERLYWALSSETDDTETQCSDMSTNEFFYLTMNQQRIDS